MAYPQNLAKVVLNWQLPNSLQAQNVLHVSKVAASDITVGDCGAIGAEFKAWWNTSPFHGNAAASLRSWLSTKIQLESVVVSDSGPGPAVQATTAVGEFGLAASSPLPNESAMVVSLYTNAAGRRGRGRIFVPGMNASDMDPNDGTFVAAFTTGMQATFASLFGGLSAGGLYLLAVNSKAGLTFHNVQSVVARDIPHHQRRRNT